MKVLWDAERLAAPHGQADKAVRVRRMFDAIAPTYERVNALCSVGLDRWWRRRAVALARVTREDDVLDVACGTGDFARAFAAAAQSPKSVVGTDFAHKMLCLAPGRSSAALRWCEADALRLPFADGQFSITSAAFGVRNFQDLEAGLREMYRVLRPRGRAVILEFGVPTRRPWRGMYLFYFTRVMPWVATLLSGDGTGAYRYLPESVLRFDDRSQIVAALGRAGFARVEARPLTLGVVTVYVAYRN